MFGFLVETEHNLEVMFAQSLFIITKQVESVVSIVLLVFVDVVRVCPLEGLQELSVDTVFVE